MNKINAAGFRGIRSGQVLHRQVHLDRVPVSCQNSNAQAIHGGDVDRNRLSRKSKPITKSISGKNIKPQNTYIGARAVECPIPNLPDRKGGFRDAWLTITHRRFIF